MKRTILQICVLLLSFETTRAQNIQAAIAQQFEAYGTQNLQEKLFVHTDKNFYVSGEIIWFKIYATDAQYNLPLDLSKVAYVELLNQEHKPVLQAKIAMNAATGNGTLQLPYSVNSGNYTLRAYTNWMKNGAPDFFFEKVLTIVNTLKKPEWPVIEQGVYDIQFFPEGGSLVSGIASKVAFRVVDALGKSLEASGIVINQRNDTVARFKTLRFGMGHFTLHPYGNDQYRAILNIQPGAIVSRALPTVMAKGFVMQVTDTGTENINIHVESNTGSPVFALLIHTRQVLKKTLMKELINGEADILVAKKELGDGISHITVFNEAKQAVCERLYFKKPGALALTIQPDTTQYLTRKKVALTIGSNDVLSQPVVANLSAAVYLIDSLQIPEKTSILSYLWLQSDLKGNIESPDYYFTGTDPEVAGATDNLMLTQGWRRFKWDNVLQPQKTAPEFLPETEGHLIQGKVVDKRNGQAGANIAAYLSVPREKSLFNNTISAENGAVVFNVKNFYGGNEIVVQPGAVADSFYRIDIVRPFSEKYSSAKMPAFSITERDTGLLLMHTMQAQLGNTYYSDKQQHYRYPKELDTLPFYGNADNQYYLDDYTRFITMEEVMREYVADVRVRKNNEAFSFRVNDKTYNSYFETAPLVLMDGVPVFNLNKMIDFDPLKIRKIEVVARKFFQNNFIYDGIIQYHSYQGDLSGYQLDASALVVEYEGLQLEREFYSPVYETASQTQSRLPDFRNLLYWSPEIHTDKLGKKQLTFYTADSTGKYIVVVQGITANGLAGSNTAFFTVTK